MSDSSPTSPLESLLQRLGRPRVLVIGDIILDHYIRGDVRRISPEAPIPVLHAQAEEMRLGGAGNVAHNLATLDADATLMGVIGDDHHGKRLRQLLEDKGIRSDALIVDQGRRTTLKSRMLARSQQLLRVDHEDSGPISAEVEAEVLAAFRARLAETDLVIISDYAKGLLTDSLLREVIRAGRSAGVKVIVDPKGRNYRKYRGATLLTPNLSEAQIATGEELKDDEERQLAGSALAEALGLDALIITLSADGMVLIRPGRPPFRVRSRPIQVFDVTGAGDTSIATIGLVLASGNSYEAALRLANRAGGIVVGMVGTATITRADLARAISEQDRTISGRLASPSTVTQIRNRDDEQGSTLAVVAGRFDVVDGEALALIQRASERSDRLVILAPRSCPNLAVLEDLRTPDNVIASDDFAADLRQLNADLYALASELPHLREVAEELGLIRIGVSDESSS